uniref:ATP synthase F0 subunit 8 n=1 Tax=Oscarella viridis TaxID=764033 RepID=E7DNP8_9METZ|nr:ATP synthase F0 subunit 8 [Oscarella viridis]ADO51465.1 ATP synthase F0 subunit 8 [Oscarella viridis]
MPQLDTVTFLTQYTWTLIALFILVSLLVTKILPHIEKILKIRSTPLSSKALRKTTDPQLIKKLLQL